MHSTPISLRGLIPLLSDALASHRLELPAAVTTLMRTLVLKEGLRTRAFWRVSNDVLDILEQADLAVLVLKGAVLAGHRKLAYRKNKAGNLWISHEFC